MRNSLNALIPLCFSPLEALPRSISSRAPFGVE